MDKGINNNGHDYVDLGLPSGTLWASSNVGADTPSDYGLYFQWGDTQGYSKDQIGKDKQFNWHNYKWYDDKSVFTKYTTPGATLELEDDAAHVNMGGSWHMPSPTQISELLDNTTSTWMAQDGVNGRLFRSKTDTSKSIFFPAAGFACDDEVLYIGGSGYVWSSMLGAVYACYGQYLDFGSGYVLLDYGLRFYGLSVRGVIG